MLLNKPCYQSESAKFYSLMKPLILANKLDPLEIVSYSVDALAKGRSETDIHNAYVNLSEFISLERISCDPYTRLLYGHLAYAVWRQKKEQWDLMKTRSSSGNANFSFGWDGKEDDDDEEEEGLPIGNLIKLKHCCTQSFCYRVNGRTSDLANSRFY